MIQELKELIERVESWPDDAQAELVALGLEIEAEQRGLYHASDDELAAIDQGLAEIENSNGVPEAEAEAIFARARRG